MKEDHLPRVDTVLDDIYGLEGKDLKLWSMSLLIIVALAAGLLAFILPNVIWNLAAFRLESQYLRQFFFGLAVLIVLYNIYTVDLRRSLVRTRAELVRQLIRKGSAENLSLIDPLTEAFDRRYLDYIIPKETNRADRLGYGLTFLLADLDNFDSVNTRTRFGHRLGDAVLKQFAELLKRTVRLSDTIIRYGGHAFVVLLPHTTEQGARHLVNRLLTQADGWNQRNPPVGYQMTFSHRIVAYSKGEDVQELLETAHQQTCQDEAGQ